MGIKGLYSCLKPFSHRVEYTTVPPLKLALDAYPFLYKFKHDLDSCIQFFLNLQKVGHQIKIYVDGNPPKEKMEELAKRRQQKEQAYKQAEALKLFLKDEEKSSSLDEDARKLIEKQIQAYEVESYSIKKETRDSFLQRIKDAEIPFMLCEGEADSMLIEAAKKQEVDIVVANDMDLFVGGVERLWVLGKTNTDPLFLEFNRTEITKQFGLQEKAWIDVAILAGYEKTSTLKRTSVQQAITWLRYYGSMESLFSRRKELLQGEPLASFVEARKYFI
jgi:hypothetical protein